MLKGDRERGMESASPKLPEFCRVAETTLGPRFSQLGPSRIHSAGQWGTCFLTSIQLNLSWK
jgi:hypothetical protein